MALTYGFYNSVASDRVYDAVQMGRIFDGVIEDGVYASIGDKLMVSPSSGMTVNVGTGRAWFNHTWTYNDAPLGIVISAANATLPRIDVVYLQVNEDSGVRANSISKLNGTPASSPVAPTLTNTATVHQYPLAHIYVGAGVTSIIQENITNMVGLTDTPWVTGPLSVVSTNDLLVQWEAEFMTWFDEMKDQLSTDAAGNLQLQLNSHSHISGLGAPIPTAGLQNLAVTTDKINNLAVTTEKIGDGSITTIKLVNENVTAAKIANRTRKFLVMPQPDTYYDETRLFGAWGLNYRDLRNDTGKGMFFVPSDFHSSMVIKALIYTQASGYIYAYMSATYRAVGQTSGTHNDSNGPSAVSLAANLTHSILSLSLDDVSAGDIVSLSFTRDALAGTTQDTIAGTIWLMGFLVEYTADS